MLVWEASGIEAEEHFSCWVGTGHQILSNRMNAHELPSIPYVCVFVDPLQCGTQGKAFSPGASILARKDWPCSHLIIQLSGLPLSFTKSFLFPLVLHFKYIFFLLSIHVFFLLPPFLLPFFFFLKKAISLSKINFLQKYIAHYFLKYV